MDVEIAVLAVHRMPADPAGVLGDVEQKADVTIRSRSWISSQPRSIPQQAPPDHCIHVRGVEGACLVTTDTPVAQSQYVLQRRFRR
jgi:hypothetical protein